METIEIIVYLVVSIIIGVMILSFLTGWDIRKTYQDIKEAVSGKEDQGFEEVDKPGFVSATLKLWESCGYGEIDKTRTVLVKDPINPSLTESYVLDIGVQLNIERSINDDTLDFTTDPITLPKVVRIKCDSALQKLIIS